MNKRSPAERLTLSKETIKSLVPKELQEVAGGVCCLSQGGSCISALQQTTCFRTFI